MFQRISIHNKLAVALGGAVVVAFGLASAALALFGRLTLENRIQQAIQPYAQLVSVGAESAVAFEDSRRAREILSTLQANPQVQDAGILLRDGRPLAVFRRDQAPDRPTHVLRPEGIHLEGGLAELTQPLADGAHLYLVVNVDDLNRQTRNMLGMFAAGVFVLLLATTLALRMAMQRGIVRPVAALAGAVELVRSRGNYHQRVPVSGTDEVARLGEGFNAMLSAIQEREQVLSTVFESAPFIMFLLDREEAVFRANAVACRVLGNSSPELLGQPYCTALHCMHAPKGPGGSPECRRCGLMVVVRDALHNGDSHYQEEVRLSNLHAGKVSEATYLVSTTPVKVVNQTMALLSLEDITEHKRLEANLLQSQKMEAVGQLAGGVAHDFNNILTAIIGFGNLAKMKMTPEDPQAALIEQILQAADRAANLTHGLLAFSRKQVILPRPVDVNNLVGSIEKLLNRLIGEDIELIVRRSEIPLIVMADAGQIEQVLMNLATNARDAMSEGGTLLITTELRTISEGGLVEHGLSHPGKFALMTVSDTGAGMDEVTRSKIFEPFFTTKELGRGTGLGLSIVYGIVRQHEGAIMVYSELGRGTTFRVYLPLLDLAMEKSQGEVATLPAGGDETVLIAEDDPELRTLTSKVLSEFGYRVIESADGQEALELYMKHRNKIDLLLLDVIMPRMCGKEVYDRVKAIEPGQKALFISGYTADFIHKKGIFEQGINFISKPMSPIELLRKVRSVLDSA